MIRIQTPTKTKWAIMVGLLLLFCLCSAVFVERNVVAYFVWNTYRIENLALWLSSNPAVLSVRIGNYYFNVEGSGVHDPEKAKEAYKRAVQINPRVKYAHFQLGRLYFIEGDFNKAFAELRTELQEFPENGRVHYVLGLVYGYRNFPGDFAKAEENFKQFIEWDPKNWAGYNDLAWVQIKQRKFSDAQHTVESAFQNLPSEKDRNVWLWNSLGIAQLNQKNYSQSKDAFSTAESLAENMTAEYFWSAYPGNNSTNAETAFKQFLSTLHFNLGIVYEKMERWDKAQEEYQKYLGMLPDGSSPEQYAVEQKIKQISTHLE